MSVTVSVKLGGVTLPGTNTVADIAIRSGRARTDDGLNPATATVEFLTISPGGVTAEIGTALQILVNGSSRFIGKVSEITRSTSTSGAETTFTVVAAGNIAQLERVMMTLPLPAETAAARATRAIQTAAGFTISLAGGTAYNMAAFGKAGDAPASAADVLSALMVDTGAVVNDLGDGKILAQFPEGRISGDRFTPRADLTHSEISFEMTDDIYNEAVIEYAGVVSTSTNATSVTKYGKRSIGIQTGLADIGSAAKRGGSLVARLGVPVWRVNSALTWDEATLVHGIGAVVTLAPLPAGSPVVGNYVGVLEGWTDHYRPIGDGSNLLGGSWELALADQRQAAEALIWSQANPAEKWNTTNVATKWQDCLSNANL